MNNSPASEKPLQAEDYRLVADRRLKNFFGKSITLLQMAVDYSTVLACYLGSYFFYVYGYRGYSPQSLERFFFIAAIIAGVYVFIIERVGLYQREISLLNIKELRETFHVGIYAAAIIFSAGFYIRSFSLSRVTFTTAIILTPVILYLQRQIFYRIHILFHQKGWSHTRILIFGAGNIGTQIAKRLYESPTLGLLPIGFLDDDDSRHGKVVKWIGLGAKQDVRVLGGEDWLARCKEFGVEMVLIALPSAKFERNQQLVEMCIQNGIEYAIVPNAYEQFIQQIEMFEIGGIPLLRRRKQKVGLFYTFFKRLLDFILSFLFIALLSPLYIFIGFAIRLDSKGPIIFKQKRVGLRGKEFSFYKFRSMYTDAPKYERTPSDPHDPRITKIGRWLRRTSLDELPQLFNVLRGDMSLVGPRPEMPFIVSKYTPLEKRRLQAKPGITGVWQISSARSAPIHENIEYDLFYLEHRSILLDMAIIVKTILSVIKGVGAI